MDSPWFSEWFGSNESSVMIIVNHLVTKYEGKTSREKLSVNERIYSMDWESSSFKYSTAYLMELSWSIIFSTVLQA